MRKEIPLEGEAAVRALVGKPCPEDGGLISVQHGAHFEDAKASCVDCGEEVNMSSVKIVYESKEQPSFLDSLDARDDGDWQIIKQLGLLGC